MPSVKVTFPSLSPSIQEVIANHLLLERPVREPDYKAQVEATAEIVNVLLETPDTVLAKLSMVVRRLTGADSAGVSLAGRQAGKPILLWQAACGLFEPYLGTVVDYSESPCGSVIDLDALMLMVEPARAFPTAAKVDPPIREVLLVPFHSFGRTIGTVWVISQGAKVFDVEDARIASDISELAALAYQVLTELGNLTLLSRTVQLVADSKFNELAE